MEFPSGDASFGQHISIMGQGQHLCAFGPSFFFSALLTHFSPTRSRKISPSDHWHNPPITNVAPRLCSMIFTIFPPYHLLSPPATAFSRGPLRFRLVPQASSRQTCQQDRCHISTLHVTWQPLTRAYGAHTWIWLFYCIRSPIPPARHH